MKATTAKRKRSTREEDLVNGPPSSLMRSIGRRFESHEHRDPVTGDMLTTGEWISWKIQEVIRNWIFLGILTVVTIVCWVTNNPLVLTWWNLNASFYAVILETIVGVAFFNQTRRDAVVMRENRTISKHIERIAELQLQIMEHLEQQFARIESLEEITGKLLNQSFDDGESSINRDATVGRDVSPDSAPSPPSHKQDSNAYRDARRDYRQSTDDPEGSESSLTDDATATPGGNSHE